MVQAYRLGFYVKILIILAVVIIGLIMGGANAAVKPPTFVSVAVPAP